MAISENWTRENIAWAAGLFEGEGSCYFRDRKQGTSASRSACVVLNMTDEDVIRKLHRIIGLGSVNGPYQPPGNRKPVWRWSVTGSEQPQAVLAAFWPFLCSRRQAKIAEVLAQIATINSKCADRTECPQGHPYSSENTAIHASGARRCKQCSRDQAIAYYYKKKEAAHGYQHVR